MHFNKACKHTCKSLCKVVNNSSCWQILTIPGSKTSRMIDIDVFRRRLRTSAFFGADSTASRRRTRMAAMRTWLGSDKGEAERSSITLQRPSARANAVLIELGQRLFGFVRERDTPSSTCKYSPTTSSAIDGLFAPVVHRQKNRHSIVQESSVQV